MMRVNLRRTIAAAAASAIVSVSAVSLASADASRERVAGTDRYLTSVAISTRMVPEVVGTVLVASGEDYPDAVVAGAAGGAYGYPVLLTARDSAPPALLAEIERLDPTVIVILGGPAAVSRAVEEQLAQQAVVTRLGDTNRYGTAVKVSRWAFDPGLRIAYIASGAGFADALSAGVVGARNDGPVLLTDPDVLSPETAAHLAEYQPRQIVLLGGTGAISEAVADAVAEFAPVSRLAGDDRYSTSAAVSAATFRAAKTVLVASGVEFPDALSGTPWAAQLQSPVLLVERDSVSPEVCAEVRRLGAVRVIALGGPAAVSDTVLDRITRQCTGPLPGPTPTVGPPSEVTSTDS